MKGSRAYRMLSFGLPGKGFWLWNPQEKSMHHKMMLKKHNAGNYLNLMWNFGYLNLFSASRLNLIRLCGLTIKGHVKLNPRAALNTQVFTLHLVCNLRQENVGQPPSPLCTLFELTDRYAWGSLYETEKWSFWINVGRSHVEILEHKC